MSILNVKSWKEINITTPDVKASLVASIQLAVRQLTRQSSTITTDATITKTVGTTGLTIVENHPLIPVYGVFQEDPTWGQYMQNIKQYREEIDELVNA